MNTQEAKIVLETALICAQEPLRVNDLRRLFDDDVGADTIRVLLEELRQDWRRAAWNWWPWPAAGASRAGRKCVNTSIG